MNFNQTQFVARPNVTVGVVPRAQSIPMYMRAGVLYTTRPDVLLLVNDADQEEIRESEAEIMVKLEHPTFLMAMHNELIAPIRFLEGRHPRDVYCKEFALFKELDIVVQPGASFVVPNFAEAFVGVSCNPTMLHNGRRCQMSVIGLAPNEFLPLETHPHAAQILYVVSGIVKVQTHRDTVVLVPGSSIVIPPGMPHMVSNDTMRTLANLLSVYTPHAHAESLGIYDYKAQMGVVNESSRKHVQNTSTEPVVWSLAVRHSLRCYGPNVKNVIACGKADVNSIIISPPTAVTMNQEGYYYVTHGNVNLLQNGSGQMQLAPGALFYNAPGQEFVLTSVIPGRCAGLLSFGPQNENAIYSERPNLLGIDPTVRYSQSVPQDDIQPSDKIELVVAEVHLGELLEDLVDLEEREARVDLDLSTRDHVYAIADDAPPLPERDDHLFVPQPPPLPARDLSNITAVPFNSRNVYAKTRYVVQDAQNYPVDTVGAATLLDSLYGQITARRVYIQDSDEENGQTKEVEDDTDDSFWEDY